MSDGQAHCQSPLQSLHLFGSYGDPASVANLPQFTKTLPTTWSAKSPRPRLWLVQGTGYSRQRRDAGAALEPLTREQVAQRVDSYADRPMSKLSVKLGRQRSRRPLLIDGDGALVVYASDVTVDALVPPDVVNVDEYDGTPTAGARTVAVDDILGCEILGIPTSDGYSPATFSQYVLTTAGQATRFPVPHGALEVLVQPQTASTTLGTWTFNVGDASFLGGVALQLGTFTPDNTPVQVPGASHLEASTDPSARAFLLTWKIR